MLYVFQVDTGEMYTVEMCVALESVELLKREVEKLTKIPVDEQVLLISGGDTLSPNANVCSYPAGTDTCPFYLFSKSMVDIGDMPILNNNFGAVVLEDLKAKVKETSELLPSFGTVVKRTQLADYFQECAEDLVKVSQKWVYCQHQQNQGWLAVIANLEDLIKNMRRRWEMYHDRYREYLDEREAYKQLLKEFKKDIGVLQRIPLLPSLVSQHNSMEKNSGTDEQSTNPNTTLLDWISQQDDFVDHLYEHCSNNLEQMDENLLSALENDVESTMKLTNFPEMKEIKGLSDRLMGLEKLMNETKKLSQQQRDLALFFQQSQLRSASLRDQTILNDLCSNHLNQVNVLLENHNNLTDITRRIKSAKDELCKNLNRRLRWVIYMESCLLELDNRLVFSFESLSTLHRQFDVLQQVHQAPKVYLSAVTEVVRRRMFSAIFLGWANELACHMVDIYSDELAKRRDFQAQFDNHFLAALFTGMEDLPPAFATQPPDLFDVYLPNLTEEDLERLRRDLPEFSNLLSVAETAGLKTFLMIRSLVKDELVERSEAKLTEVVEQSTAIEENKSEVALLQLDKGCESETDTEEFENVGQSPFEPTQFDKTSQIPTTNNTTRDASTLTEVGSPSKINTSFNSDTSAPQTTDSFHTQQLTDSRDAGDREKTASSTTNTSEITTTQCNTDSFTNLKKSSVDSISDLKNIGSGTESCFNSQQQKSDQNDCRLKSPPQSPPVIEAQSPVCCLTSGGHHQHHHHQQQQQQTLAPSTSSSSTHINTTTTTNNNLTINCGNNNDFINDEFYIDESLPSSLSIENNCCPHSHADHVNQLDIVNNVVAMLQDNLQLSRDEYDKLRSVFVKISQNTDTAKTELRNELSEIRSTLTASQAAFVEYCTNLRASLARLNVEREQSERELVQRLTVDHELEISDFRKISQSKNEEIRSLTERNCALERLVDEAKGDVATLKHSIAENEASKTKEIEELQSNFAKIEHELERSAKEAVDSLKLEHRGEIENIRARFKLMTMSESRSPSENSLEKIERVDSGSWTSNTETLLLQMAANYEAEKEKLIKETEKKEAIRWTKMLEEAVAQLREKFLTQNEAIISDMKKQICEDKDRQISVLREEIKRGELEAIKLRNTLMQLTDASLERQQEELKQRETKKEQQECEDQLNLSSESDEAADDKNESKTDGATSVMHEKTASEVLPCTDDGMTDSVSVAKQSCPSEANIDAVMVQKPQKSRSESSKLGDMVFIKWEPKHSNFRVFTKSTTYLHFLHTECFAPLGLKILHNKPNKLECYAEFVCREFCKARKATNRFKVDVGERFFRVRVRPMHGGGINTTPSQPHSPQSLAKSEMSQSQFLDGVAATISALPADKMSRSMPCAILPDHLPVEEGCVSTCDTEGGWKRMQSLTEESFIVEEEDRSFDLNSISYSEFSEKIDTHEHIPHNIVECDPGDTKEVFEKNCDEKMKIINQEDCGGASNILSLLGDVSTEVEASDQKKEEIEDPTEILESFMRGESTER